MARSRDPIVKQSRREGYALHPKAHKALAKKEGGPGEQGNGRRRQPSQYGIQLREKQKVRRLYGLLEKQFRNLVKKSARMQGQTGENMLSLLEKRLDNVVYRSGLARSRQAARQLVNHSHFLINGRKSDVPSQIVSVGDEITVKPKSHKNSYFKDLDNSSPKPSSVPAWLEVNRSKLTIKIKGQPTRDDAEEGIQEQLIVEYYSR